MASSIPSFLYTILVLLPFLFESNNESSCHHHNSNNECLGKKKKNCTSWIHLDIVRCPTTRVRLLITMMLNFLCDFVYQGLSLNVVNLKNNLYLNVLLNAVGEMPTFVITAVLLGKFGRKPLTVATMWFSGFFCLMGSLMKNFGVWKILRMVCGVLAVSGMAGTYNLLYIYGMFGMGVR